MVGRGSIEMLLVDCLSWFEVWTMLVYVFTLHSTLDGDSGRSSSLRVGARIQRRKWNERKSKGCCRGLPPPWGNRGKATSSTCPHTLVST